MLAARRSRMRLRLVRLTIFAGGNAESPPGVSRRRQPAARGSSAERGVFSSTSLFIAFSPRDGREPAAIDYGRSGSYSNHNVMSWENGHASRRNMIDLPSQDAFDSGGLPEQPPHKGQGGAPGIGNGVQRLDLEGIISPAARSRGMRRGEAVRLLPLARGQGLAGGTKGQELA